MSGEYLTMAEIEAKYPNEWVLVQCVTLDRHGHMKTGKVLFHGLDGDEVYAKAMELPPPVDIAVYHTTGPILSADEAFAL